MADIVLSAEAPTEGEPPYSHRFLFWPQLTATSDYCDAAGT